MSDTDKTIIERVKTEFGGASGLASRLNAQNPSRAITSQAISQWRQVPAERVVDVEAVTGIAREDLRPDLAAIFSARDSQALPDGAPLSNEAVA